MVIVSVTVLIPISVETPMSTTSLTRLFRIAFSFSLSKTKGLTRALQQIVATIRMRINTLTVLMARALFLVRRG